MSGEGGRDRSPGTVDAPRNLLGGSLATGTPTGLRPRALALPPAGAGAVMAARVRRGLIWRGDA
jgi:hypothetical protein